jgi:hypothetical protein
MAQREDMRCQGLGRLKRDNSPERRIQRLSKSLRVTAGLSDGRNRAAPNGKGMGPGTYRRELLLHEGDRYYGSR